MRHKKAMKWIAAALLLTLALAAFIPGTGAAPPAQEPESVACGDYIVCSTASDAVYVRNTGTGAVIYGHNTSTGFGLKGRGNPGVYGFSYHGAGIRGKSRTNMGVKAESDSGYAIYATSTGFRGGYFSSGGDSYPDLVLGANSAASDNGTIFSEPSDPDSDLVFYAMDKFHIHLDYDQNTSGSNFEVRNYLDVTVLESQMDGDLLVGNDLYLHAYNDSDVGEIRATSSAYHDMMLTSNDDIFADLDEDGNQSDSCFSFRRSDHSTIQNVCESKGTTFSGSQQVAVDTSAGQREMYTPGSTELWFEDLGSAALVEGQATITIDPLFAETVNLDAGYHVFVQVYGNADVFVTNRSPVQFEVRLREGDPNVAFSYRIVAKRLGYEAQRLEEANLAPTEEGEP